MDKYIQVLENNDGMCDCAGSWGSILRLAVKPHQEDYTNIKFVLVVVC